MFDLGMQKMLKQAMACDNEGDALLLAKADRDVVLHNGFKFDGKFESGCQKDRTMVPCDHEEADTRLLIHLQEALQNNCTNCVVRTVDTDVVPPPDHPLPKCEHFGTGKSFTYYHINKICEDLGTEKSLALPHQCHV
jgi:hypothetical protein